MKLLFHIGSGKTGTSSIQETMKRNKDILLEQGILYPLLGHFRCHNVLSLSFQTSTIPREFKSRHNVSRENVDEFAKRFYDEFTQSLQSFDGHTVILSGEYFFRQMEPELQEKFTALLTPYFSEIQVLAYIRPPGDLFLSKLQQRLKGSWKIGSITPFQYCEILDFYRALYPVKVVKFDRSSLKGGNVIVDFLSHVGNINVNDLTLHETNTSVSAEGMQFLKEYREMFFYEQNNKLTRASSNMVKTLQRIEAEKKLNLTKSLLYPEVRAFLHKSSPDLERLYENYGINFIEDDVKPLTKSEIDAFEEENELSNIMHFDRDLKNTLMHNLLYEISENSQRKDR